MVEIDRSCIVPEELRPKHALRDEGENIPLIDLSPITNRDFSSDPKAVQDLADKVGHACKTWGFFTVINHGVPSDVKKKIMEVSRKLFALPLEEKVKFRRADHNTAGFHNDEHSKDLKDWKETFDFYVNDGMLMPASHEPDDPEVVHWFTPWPRNFPEFRYLITVYILVIYMYKYMNKHVCLYCKCCMII